MTTTAAETIKPKTDFLLLGVTLVLTCLGILLIFDASYQYALTEKMSVYKFVRQQSVFAIVGIVAMLVIARTPYKVWGNKAALSLMGASLIGMLMVYIPHVGIVHNHARRWIGHGGFEVQPSELAKLAVIIYVANSCAGRPKQMGRFWDGPFPPLFTIGILAALAAKEPDLGTGTMIALAGLATLFFAGMKARHLVICLTIAAVIGIGMIFHGHGASANKPGQAAGNYQANRITSFLHPEQDTQGSTYQLHQALIGFGSGGVLGMGIGTGREKYFLPESYTDYIFAVLGEEAGLIGTLFVLLLYLLLIGRGMHIASRTQDPFGALLAAGITATFGLQALLNMAGVTASIPDTGVPLPFISYGGTSLVLSLILVGLLMSIHRFAEVNEAIHPVPRTATTDQDFDRRWDRGATLSRPEYRQDLPVAPSRSRHRPAVSRTSNRALHANRIDS